MVSSARFVSLLSNRHRTVDDIAAALTTTCDLHALAERDQAVELADLEAMAKFFSRSWPYLLIDEPEHLQLSAETTAGALVTSTVFQTSSSKP